MGNDDGSCVLEVNIFILFSCFLQGIDLRIFIDGQG